MRDEYDLSDAVRHPLAGQFKGKYTVITHYDLSENDDFDDDVSAEANLAVAETAGTYSTH